MAHFHCTCLTAIKFVYFRWLLASRTWAPGHISHFNGRWKISITIERMIKPASLKRVQLKCHQGRRESQFTEQRDTLMWEERVICQVNEWDGTGNKVSTTNFSGVNEFKRRGVCLQRVEGERRGRSQQRNTRNLVSNKSRYTIWCCGEKMVRGKLRLHLPGWCKYKFAVSYDTSNGKDKPGKRKCPLQTGSKACRFIVCLWLKRRKKNFLFS